MITCLTPPISVVRRVQRDLTISDADTSPATVHVKFDAEVTRHLTSQRFTYYENPVVSDVTPRRSYRRLFIIYSLSLI